MAYHNLTLLWFSLLTGPNVFVDAVMGFTCMTTVRPEGTRGWPSWVVPVQAEIIITCAQNIRISVIWLPSNHLTKTLSDSSCMTLKKCWATPSVVLFYQSLWVWEKGLFFKQKITHFVSFFFCFSKLKLIYPTWTRKISPSLSVIKIINFFFPLSIKCQLIMQRRHFQKDS